MTADERTWVYQRNTSGTSTLKVQRHQSDDATASLFVLAWLMPAPQTIDAVPSGSVRALRLCSVPGTVEASIDECGAGHTARGKCRAV